MKEFILQVFQTIGESPMAYKRPKLILENITNLVILFLH